MGRTLRFLSTDADLAEYFVDLGLEEVDEQDEQDGQGEHGADGGSAAQEWDWAESHGRGSKKSGACVHRDARVLTRAS